MEVNNERETKKRLRDATDTIGLEPIDFDDTESFGEDESNDAAVIDIVGFFESLASAWLDKNGLKIFVSQIKKDEKIDHNLDAAKTRKGCVVRRK